MKPQLSGVQMAGYLKYLTHTSFEMSKGAHLDFQYLLQQDDELDDLDCRNFGDYSSYSSIEFHFIKQ